MDGRKIIFVSAMKSVPWGGSEYLWAGAAERFLAQGAQVGVCVKKWGDPVAEVTSLVNQGADLCYHHYSPQLAQDFFSKIRYCIRPPSSWIANFKQWVCDFAPEHVCVSGGNFADGTWALDILNHLNISYSIVVQANAEFLWPSDPVREKLRPLYQKADAVFCVSEANLSLLENQLALSLPQAKVVRNPVNVSRDFTGEWPSMQKGLKCACVGRLDPAAKGQDLILNVLAQPEWQARKIEVNLYGAGSSEQGLRELIRKYGVADKVHLNGFVSDISEVWSSNHVCLMPSRYEGMPLAMVEAMFCHRAVVATDVAGHAEFLENGVEGILASGATRRAWASAMDELWHQRDRLQVMGDKAFEKAQMLVEGDPCNTFVDLLSQLINERV